MQSLNNISNNIRRAERGDTIIEVVIAFAAFALVMVIAVAIMNQGIATAERSLEVTLVRQQVDSQAEAIRYIHKAYTSVYDRNSKSEPDTTTTAGQWPRLRQLGVSESSVKSFTAQNGQCLAPLPSNAFFVDTRSKAPGMVVSDANRMRTEGPEGGSLPPFAQIADGPSGRTAYGVWVQSVPSGPQANGGVEFIDFHIKACWADPSTDNPLTIGTIVRLYEPQK